MLISCCCTFPLHQLSVIHTLLFEFRSYIRGNTLRVTCQGPSAVDLWTDLLQFSLTKHSWADSAGMFDLQTPQGFWYGNEGSQTPNAHYIRLGFSLGSLATDARPDTGCHNWLWENFLEMGSVQIVVFTLSPAGKLPNAFLKLCPRCTRGMGKANALQQVLEGHWQYFQVNDIFFASDCLEFTFFFFFKQNVRNSMRTKFLLQISIFLPKINFTTKTNNNNKTNFHLWQSKLLL